MKTLGLPAALLLLGTQSLSANEDGAASIVVTATRTAETVDDTLAAVTVITREDIQRQQALSVPDVLRGVPGVDIANNGGAGKRTSLFLRGTEADHVLVLVDGVKVGSATFGTAAFQDIPVDQIERIEVVRGPRSSLYGSEAIGGVIQIFTRKGGGPLTPSFSVGTGNYGTYKTSADISGGGANAWYRIGASYFDTDGFNACDGPGGCGTIDPDDDSYRNRSGALRAGYRFGTDAEVEFHTLHAEGHTEFDGSTSSGNESDFIQQVLGGRLRLAPLAGWQATLSAGRSRDESDNFLNGTFRSRFDTERDTASFQNDITLGADHLLTLGADYQNDRIDSTRTFAFTSRDDTGLFAQYRGGLGAQDVLLALRRDDNEQFGRRDTGSLAWGYAVSRNLRLVASYGTAFKAPTFNELYFPGYGNPNLEPEESESVELGLRGAAGGLRWALSAYQAEVDNLIAFDPTTFAPANIDTARIRGLEAEVFTRLGGWDLSTGLTLLDPENRSDGADRGNRLPRRAGQSLHLALDRGFGRYRLGATLLAAGRRYDDLANTRELGGYATVDLRAEYALIRDWRLEGRVGNLFDKDYETVAFFNQAGRNVFLTLRYQPRSM